jgi:hypothetical protein
MFGSVLPAATLLLGIGPVESGQADANRAPAPTKQSASASSASPSPPAPPNRTAAPASPEPKQIEKANPDRPAPDSSTNGQKVPISSAPRIATPVSTIPADVASEIASVESMQRSILVNQPIEQWRFDNVRARYQTLLKQAGTNSDIEEALRVRLAKVTRYEQASRAARTITTILAQSRERDRVVAAIQSRLAAKQSSPTPSYSAVGFLQRSSSMLDGHKVYALIGPTGSTVAYLDIPPGLDVNAHFAHRVGIRGVVHYNEDLGARLISVRDIEALGTTRR